MDGGKSDLRGRLMLVPSFHNAPSRSQTAAANVRDGRIACFTSRYRHTDNCKKTAGDSFVR